MSKFKFNPLSNNLDEVNNKTVEITNDEGVSLDTILSWKANQDTTYTKDETNILLDEKVDISSMSSNIVLYSTTSSWDFWYTKLVTDIDSIDYNTIPVDVSTGEIIWSNQLVWSLISDSNILIWNPWIVTLTTLWNIKKISWSPWRFAEFYFEIYKRDNIWTETLICTSSVTPQVESTWYEQFLASCMVNDWTFLSTDRLVIKYYANVLWTWAIFPVYEFQFWGANPVRTLIPVPVSVVPTSTENFTLTQFQWPGSANVWSLVWVWPENKPAVVLANPNFPVDEVVTILDKWFVWIPHITDTNLNLATFWTWQTIRWIAVSDYALVYVANQTTTSENGFYVMSPTTHLLTFIRWFDAAWMWTFVYPAHDSSTLYIFKYTWTIWNLSIVWGWAPVNMVTTDTNQTIWGIKTFSLDWYFNTVRIGRWKNSRIWNILLWDTLWDDISTGTYNTLIWTSVAQYLTTWYWNTLIWAYAWNLVWSGHNNTFIWNNAWATWNFSNSIAIWDWAVVTWDNEIILWNTSNTSITLNWLVWTAPATPTSTWIKWTIIVDWNHTYTCIATNSWVRSRNSNFFETKRISWKKTLVDNTVTWFLDITVPVSTMLGWSIDYTIKCTDWTDFQAHTWLYKFSAINKAWTVTSASNEVSTAETTIVTAWTLSDNFSITNTWSSIQLNMNSNTSFSSTTEFTISYNVILDDWASTITQL